MHIEGITCCVGLEYFRRLGAALDVWLATLDRLTVVTTPSFVNCITVVKGNTQIVTTEVFYDGGAYFNKGKALNVGMEFVKPTDWILAFDADVIPPASWRTIAEERAEIGCIHGARRNPDSIAGGRLIPRGYFQLWHSSDPCAAPFAECYEHAGFYDMDFLDGWPRHQWRELPITLTHQGELRTNWHGEGNEQLTRDLVRGNLGKARRAARLKADQEEAEASG